MQDVQNYSAERRRKSGEEVVVWGERVEGCEKEHRVLRTETKQRTTTLQLSPSNNVFKSENSIPSPLRISWNP